MDPVTPMRMSKVELARRLGVTKGRVSQLVAEGLPVLPDGAVEPMAAASWVLANLVDRKAAETRGAARELLGVAMTTAGAMVAIQEVPLAVATAAADMGLSRPVAERLAAVAHALVGLAASEELERAGALPPATQTQAAWAAAINWPRFFGADGASVAVGCLSKEAAAPGC